jgi:hypothetical protein
MRLAVPTKPNEWSAARDEYRMLHRETDKAAYGKTRIVDYVRADIDLLARPKVGDMSSAVY